MSVLAKKTTRALLATFALLLLLSTIGMFSQMKDFAIPLDPREEHPSHMLALDSGDVGQVHIDAGDTYSIYVEKGEVVNKEELRLINISSQESIDPLEQPDSIPGGLQGEDGTAFTSVLTWIPVDAADVALQNNANTTIWLVNETAVIQSIIDNDLMIGSMFGCLASACLVPVIVLWFIVNQKRPSDLAVKLAANELELEHIAGNNDGRVPTTDELYRVVHSNQMQVEQEKDGHSSVVDSSYQNNLHDVPAPFVDRPDIRTKGHNIVPKQNSDIHSLPKTTEALERSEAGTWKEWDEG